MPVCRVVIADITERKQAEEALHTLSNYNRSLIEASLAPLVTIDPDGTGSLPATVHTFQRRNGALGPMSSALRAAPRSAPIAAEAGEAQS